MAQDIDLLGAVYPDVPAVELPKDGGGTALFTDVSDTTADAADVADGEYFYKSNGVRSLGTGKYAAAPVANGNAKVANAILYGTVDGTSTSTVFTATVSGLTELVDGTCVMLHNGVVTSASGFTINLNNLGAKKCYNNMTNATQDTTIFNVNYTMLFVYSSALDSGAGGWWIYRGYNSDNNTIGYQIRTNSTSMPTISRTRYYRLLFTSADRTKWVPANTTYDNSATSIKTPNSNAIDPFGRIVYMTGTTNVPAGSNVGATVTWDQYALALGYSFNTTGQALTLTYPAPVFVKCAPQTNGSAIIDSTTPYVQALPSTADGKIYIYLGMAYSATNIELVLEHPVYWHDGTALRLWTGAADSGGDVTMTEAEVDAAVEAAWPVPRVVTISLTNPRNSGEFGTCKVYESADGIASDLSGALLANIESPTGTVTVNVDISLYGIIVAFQSYSSMQVDSSGITNTGGVSYTDMYNSGGTRCNVLFEVTADGTATIDGADWDY